MKMEGIHPRSALKKKKVLKEGKKYIGQKLELTFSLKKEKYKGKTKYFIFLILNQTDG